MMVIWLVVTGTMEFILWLSRNSWEWNVIIPTDELHHFSEGAKNHQPVDDFHWLQLEHVIKPP